MAAQLQSGFGIVALLAICWFISENRWAVSWRRVFASLLLTLVLAVLLLKIPALKVIFEWVNDGVAAIAGATRAGTSFVFGYLGGAPLPFELQTPGSEFILAFQALPVVLVVSVLTSLLFYWRILPPIVRGFSWLLERTLGIGGAVGLSTAANIFLGMVEAPLFIRPYIAQLSRAELFIVMTGGMAGIAGTVFVIYAIVLAPSMPDVAGHLLIASILAAPAAILVSELMVPERRKRSTEAPVADPTQIATSNMDAIVTGTAVGLQLLLNICAMLVVLIALVHLVNAVLGLLPDAGGLPITLERLLAYAMGPICWLMGIPWAQASEAGALLGIKTVLNEFLAFFRMAALPADALDPRSRLIMIYALCGFANFGSLGIMIAGLGVMAPERRADILSLGWKSIISGTLTTCLLGAIVGVLH